VLTVLFGGGSCAADAALRSPEDFAGLTPHRPNIQPPTFLPSPWPPLEPEEEIDRVSLLLARMLERKYAVLLCALRDSVGRAVTVDELVSVSADIIEDGVPSLLRGFRRALPLVMVSCEGRDFSV